MDSGRTTTPRPAARLSSFSSTEWKAGTAGRRRGSASSVYDALVRTARLARTVWGDAEEAARLEKAAADLRDRFRRDFWMTGPDFPALALAQDDGNRQVDALAQDDGNRQVDALASDAGHLLWSGILDPADARTVGRRLLQPDFFSGWGIRTLAAGQAPYHPLSYHRGSIWPHDNAIVVLGLARSGLTEEASEVAHGLVRAAAAHDWRLPEVMAGYGRDEHPVPVPYALLLPPGLGGGHAPGTADGAQRRARRAGLSRGRTYATAPGPPP